MRNLKKAQENVDLNFITLLKSNTQNFLDEVKVKIFVA